MVTFIMLAFSFSIFLNYTRGLIKSKSDDFIKVQADFLVLLDQTEKEGGKSLFKKIFIVVGIMMTLYYLLFFIISAIIFDMTWITYAACLLGVISVQNILLLFDLLKHEKIVKTSYLINKIVQILGFLYTGYFIVYYMTLKFDLMDLARFGWGIGVGVLVLFICLVKKRTKDLK